MSMCLRRHHLRGPGNAETASLASPPPPPHQWRNRHYTMPQKGSNYRMDGRLLYKYEAADRPGRACWCQVSNKYQQDRVTAELPRVDSVRNTDTFQHQKQAKTRGETEAIDIFWSLWCCTTVLEFQTIKRELWSDWNKIPVMTNNAALDSQKLQSCSKIIISHFQNMRSHSCLKHISPSVRSSVSWLSKCGRGRQRQADTLAFPYGTFCKAIGVSLHDPDCHWLVMKASRAEADPSLWGMEVGVRGRPGGLEGWAWARQPCCLSLTMHHCMTANLVWLVHNGRSRARLYEQSFPAPSSQQPTQRKAKRSQNTLDRH